MKLIKSELFKRDDNPNTIYLCTTNSVKGVYGLIMGAGSASEMKKRIPNISSEIVSALPDYKLDGTEDYGLLILQYPNHSKFGYGVFQTKRHWRDSSVMDTIILSTQMLCSFAYNNPFIHIRMPFPGIGYGGLAMDEVLDVIKVLPDNVSVYYR